MAYHYLEVTRGNNLGRRYLLADGVISIGRSSDNTISLDSNDRVVSSRHLVIYKYPDSITLQDMGSTNGTFINEVRVDQQIIAINDEIGFGEKGPRLKLIESETELSTAPKTAIRKAPSKTDATESSLKHKTGIEKEEQNNGALFSKTKTRPSGTSPFGGIGSMTMEIEKKLQNKEINADEMHKLMDSEERVEKILQQGNLGATQSHFLHTAFAAHKKTKKKALIVLCIVIGISLIVSSFFAVRMFQYRSQVTRTLSLEKELDALNQQMDKARKSGANISQISSLNNEYEKKQAQFNSATMTLKAEDFGRIYADTTEMFIAEIMGRFGDANYHIPPQMAERVKYHLNEYTGRLNPIISRYLQRKTVYFPMIKQVFTTKKVPLDLAYISMLESGFNPKALSGAGARGLWQFMPATAQRFGLRVDQSIDERLDPEKTTGAAAEYFKDLIGIFGGQSSVMLAMAAYNAGEGRVMGALRKIDDPMRNRDFWYIYRMGYLAEETNEYIPRVIAMMIIDTHPQRYGFTIDRPNDIHNIEAEDDFIPQPKVSDNQ